jgi:hypothetical protein
MPNDKLRSVLEKFIQHYYCEDTWYACPCAVQIVDDHEKPDLTKCDCDWEKRLTQAEAEIRKLMVPDFQDLKDIVWKKTFSDYMSAEIAKAIYEFMEGRV